MVSMYCSCIAVQKRSGCTHYGFPFLSTFLTNSLLGTERKSAVSKQLELILSPLLKCAGACLLRRAVSAFWWGTPEITSI